MKEEKFEDFDLWFDEYDRLQDFQDCTDIYNELRTINTELDNKKMLK